MRAYERDWDCGILKDVCTGLGKQTAEDRPDGLCRWGAWMIGQGWCQEEKREVGDQKRGGE